VRLEIKRFPALPDSPSGGRFIHPTGTTGLKNGPSGTLGPACACPQGGRVLDSRKGKTEMPIYLTPDDWLVFGGATIAAVTLALLMLPWSGGDAEPS
jgi:hypothetical protein